MERRMAQNMKTVFLCLALLLGVLAMSTHSQEPSAAPPFYADKQNLLNYIDDQGVTHPVQSRADWEKRRAHIMANMLLVMGEMPDESKRVPLSYTRSLGLDVIIVDSTALGLDLPDDEGETPASGSTG